MTAFVLKLIAAASMLTDHAGLILFHKKKWMRIVGRLAFPLFAFLITEGFQHTRNRRRYGISLALFALLSDGVPENDAADEKPEKLGSRKAYSR